MEEGREKEGFLSCHLRKKGQGLQHLEQEKIPDILQNNRTALCSPPSFPGLLATLNLSQAGTASGNKLLFQLQNRSPIPLKRHFDVRLSHPAHPEVGGATGKDATPTTEEEIQAEVGNLPKVMLGPTPGRAWNSCSLHPFPSRLGCLH